VAPRKSIAAIDSSRVSSWQLFMPEICLLLVGVIDEMHMVEAENWLGFPDPFQVAKERKEMLVLSRKAGERLMIGPNIVVTVLEVRGNVVKLGCVAPMEVPIHREEVKARLVAEEVGHPSHSPYFAECA
jgi:carbon storage regulator